MNNYYKMNYDMETYDELLEKQEPQIYSDTCNIREIEVKGVKKLIQSCLDLKITKIKTKYCFFKNAERIFFIELSAVETMRFLR